MEWKVEDIKNNAFTYYELDNDSRSLSGYHVYTRCAFEGYKEMDETTKLTYIMATHSLNDDGILEEEDMVDLIDSSDFQAVKVIRGLWRKMSEDLRQAWKEHAADLNERPQVGQVEELPEKLAKMNLRTTRVTLRKWIKIDLWLFAKMVNRSIRNENQRDLNKKAVQFPHSVDIKKQIYCTGTLSAMLIEVLFGEKLKKLKEWELISNRGSDPFTYHIFSEARVSELFTFQDLEISSHQDNRAGVKISLCPYGVVANEVNQSTFAYAMRETRNTVTMIFNEDEGVSRTLIFPKPTLAYSDNGQRRIITGYKCDGTVVSGWKLIQFNPVCLYISLKNTNNFKLLAAKVCIDGDGQLVVSKSSC